MSFITSQRFSYTLSYVYVSMPTRSGESLCFQLPGVMQDNRVTNVFSTLLAKLKIQADSINFKMSNTDHDRELSDLKSIHTDIRFLYITLEQTKMATFKELKKLLFKHKNIAYVVVDKAHCVSEWGYDFRPDYFKLSYLRSEYPSIPWIAETETASKQVVGDIFKHLRLKEQVASHYQDSGRAGKKSCRCVYHCQDLCKSIDFLLRQDLGKSKNKDAMEEKANLVVKHFEQIADVCETAYCLHKLFSELCCGDPADCNGMCDPKKEEKAIETFQKLSDFVKLKTKTAYDDNFDDLYEGGRKGYENDYGGDNDDYEGDYGGDYDDDSDDDNDDDSDDDNDDDSDDDNDDDNDDENEDDDDDNDDHNDDENEGDDDDNDDDNDDENEGDEKARDQRAKRETELLIQKHFALRKASAAKELDMHKTASISRVEFAMQTSVKVNGLTISLRESYLTMLADSLKKNFDACKDTERPKNKLVYKDIVEIGVGMEYEAFTNSTAVSLYRRSIVKHISDIKAATSSGMLYPDLKEEGRLKRRRSCEGHDDEDENYNRRLRKRYAAEYESQPVTKRPPSPEEDYYYSKPKSRVSYYNRAPVG